MSKKNTYVVRYEYNGGNDYYIVRSSSFPTVDEVVALFDIPYAKSLPDEWVYIELAPVKELM